MVARVACFRAILIRGMITMTVNPQQLKIAREYAGFSQTRLAQVLGTSQSRLSRAEKGSAALNEGLLAQLAQTCGVSPTFFQKFDQLPITISKALSIKGRALTLRATTRLRAYFHLVRIGLNELMTCIDEESPFVVPDASNISKSPEFVAQRLRDAWSVHRGPITNLTQYLENADVVIIETRPSILALDAISFFDTWRHPAMIFIRNDLPGEVQRFALAKELGHLVLHPNRHKTTRDKYVIMEQDAQRFAFEWLMPAEVIKSDFTRLGVVKLTRLKERWGISISALVERAHQLDAISTRTRQRLLSQVKVCRYQDREVYPLEPEAPQILQRLVRYHLDHLDYSLDELAQALHVTRSTLLREFVPLDLHPEATVVTIDPAKLRQRKHACRMQLMHTSPPPIANLRACEKIEWIRIRGRTC